MKISTRGQYALRVMAYMAQNFEDKFSISELSSKNNISDKYLEQIIKLLVQNNLVESFRGAQGGYKLKISPEKIKVGDIIRATEGDIKLVECSACGQKSKCMTINVWAKLDELITKYLDTLTLYDVVNKNL